MIKRYTRGQQIVEAVQVKEENKLDIFNWLSRLHKGGVGLNTQTVEVTFTNPWGRSYAPKDHWIARGASGEFTVWKPEEFEKSHELIQKEN